MRFVPVKSPEQQLATMLHRSRTLRVKQRTMLLHAIYAHLAELGIATGARVSQVTKMVGALTRGEPLDLPDLARVVLETLARLVFDLQERLRTIDKQLAQWHYTNDLSGDVTLTANTAQYSSRKISDLACAKADLVGSFSNYTQLM